MFPHLSLDEDFVVPVWFLQVYDKSVLVVHPCLDRKEIDVCDKSI